MPHRLLAHAADLARAPSAHNTQPWLLTRDGAELVLGYDPARALPIADPTRRDLLLGLGAFVEVAMIVAAEQGYAIAFEPGVDHEAHTAGRFVAATAPPQRAHAAADVQARRSSRTNYEPEPVPADALAATELAVMGDGLRIEVLPAPSVVELLADGDRHAWADLPTTLELKAWLRLTRSDPRYEEDGLSYEALAMSKAEAVALRAMLARGVWPWLRRIGGPALLASFSTPVIKRPGSVLVLVGDPSSPEATLTAGSGLLRSWLELHRHGCHTHPLSQVIDAPDSNRRLHERLGLDPVAAWNQTGERALAIFRAGRSAQPVRSSRLEPGRFLPDT
ncbi:MAG: hypothetical protein JWN72_1516 [Thermoleophilia bacterium]|nr:hypothetical protein [Thermoleophilia bacterium]